MRQDLVDPAARHHIAAEKQAHAGVKRRVIGFVHRIAARAAGARASHPHQTVRCGHRRAARRHGARRSVRAHRHPCAKRLRASRPRRRCRRAAGRFPPARRRASAVRHARRMRSRRRARPGAPSSGRDPGAPRPSILIQACAARIAKAGDDRDPFSRRRKPWRIDTSRASARFKHRAPGRAIIDHDQFRSGPPAAHVQAMRAPCRRARRPAWAGGFIGVGRRLRRPRARGSRTRARRAHAARDRAGTAGVRRT